MKGIVRRRRALLPVTFRLPAQPDLSIEFQIDTGFTEALTVPAAAVERLGLTFLRRDAFILADGTPVGMAVYKATILWNGAELDVPVLVTGRRPLLGAALLDGHELNVRYAEGDTVTIEAL